MSTAVAVTDATFAEQVLEAEDTVLVEFWAEWCGPCRAVAPILDSIVADHPGTLRVVKVNVDDNPDVSLRYSVVSVPAIKIFRGGEVVKQIGGAKPRPALEHELAAFLA